MKTVKTSSHQSNAARELKALLGDDIQLLNPDNATEELKDLLANDNELFQKQKP